MIEAKLATNSLSGPQRFKYWSFDITKKMCLKRFIGSIGD